MFLFSTWLYTIGFYMIVNFHLLFYLDKLLIFFLFLLYVFFICIFAKNFLLKFRKLSCFVINALSLLLLFRYIVFFFHKYLILNFLIIIVNSVINYSYVRNQIIYGPENLTQSSLKNLRVAVMKNPCQILKLNNKKKFLNFLISGEQK